jgi:hypothetical protein
MINSSQLGAFAVGAILIYLWFCFYGGNTKLMKNYEGRK